MSPDDSEVSEVLNGGGTKVSHIDHLDLDEIRYPNWQRWPEIDSAAKRLRISTRQAFRDCRDGKLTRYLCPDSTMRFNPSELEAKRRETQLVKRKARDELDVELGNDDPELSRGAITEIAASDLARHAMRHSELLFQLTMKPLQLATSVLQDENAALRRTVEKLQEERMGVIEKYEELLSMKHERDLDLKQFEGNEERKAALVKMVIEGAGPMLIQKLTSTLGGVNADRARAGMKLLESVSPSDWAMISTSGMLTPEQVELLKKALGDKAPKVDAPPNDGAQEEVSNETMKGQET